MSKARQNLRKRRAQVYKAQQAEVAATGSATNRYVALDQECFRLTSRMRPVKP